MFERSDETLVKQALKGKKSAWLALVKKYESPVYNYALRMVSNPDDAKDLLQEVFVAVFKNLATFRGDSPFKGWLFRIAHYRCMEFYRRKRPFQSLDDVPEQIDEGEFTSPELYLSEGQQSGEVQRAMKTLPFNQRIVVELKFFSAMYV